MSGGREIERKLDLSAAASLPSFPGWTVETGGERLLDAVYFDTDDLRLARAGHSLRHRSTDGDTGTWTLKTTRVQHGSHAERDEHEVDASIRRVPGTLVDSLTAVIGGSSLERLARITTHRSITLLRRDDTTVELARDHVRSRIGRRAGPTFDELELELRAGDPADLDELQAVLVDHGAHPSHWSSKLHHVLGAVESAPTAPSSVAELVARSFDTALQRLLRHDPLLRLQPDVEAVHQARVATRRLRSDLRSLRPLLDADAAAQLHTELTWVAAALGQVRDLDVLGIWFDERRDLVDGPDGAWRSLHDALDQDRGPHVDALVAAIDGPRYVDLVESLRRATVAPPLSDDVDPSLPASHAAKLITRRSWRRLEAGVRALPHPADDESLHEVRKRAKQARYAHELALPVLGHKIARRTAGIEALQDTLGALQDTVVARQWLHDNARRLPTDAAFLAGRLYGVGQQEADDLRRRFRQTWKSLSR